MASEVEIERKGLDALIAHSKRMAGLAMKAGFTGRKGPNTAPLGDSGLSTAQIMQNHEFGLGVPERSTVRGGVADKRTEIAKAAGKGVAEVLETGKIEPAIDQPGKVAVEAMKSRIERGLPPPLAESTLDDPDQDNVLPLNDPAILAELNFRQDR